MIDSVNAVTPPTRRLSPGTIAGSLALVLVLLGATTTPVAAQRASLADRVALLEQQAAGDRGNVDLLNQITQLRNELKDLRSQIEELQRQQEQAATSARSQYLDLDGRLVRLEGGGTAAVSGSAGSSVSSTAKASAGDAKASAPPRAATLERQPAIHGDRGAIAKGQGEQADYLAAFAVLKSGDYVGSASAFQDFLERYPGGSYAPNALYWLGESYYVTQNYLLAQEQFQMLLDRYPTHDKAPGALLKVGLSQYGQGQLDATAATLAQVLSRYPGSDAARTAQDRLRAMQRPGFR